MQLSSKGYVVDRFAKIGMALAGIASIVAPLSLLTSFYGMNIQEFTSGANVSLYDFSKGALPIIFLTLVSFGFLMVWLMAE